MENKIDELIKSIDRLNSFSWGDIISLVALIGSWITIFILLKDKHNENRPYLQVTFELVKSNLTCVVLRNVGKVPLVLTHIHYNEDFINQLDERDRRYLNDNTVNNLTIFPGKEWIICLGVIVPDILNKFELKKLKVKGHINLTGGEPLCSPHFFKLLDKLKKDKELSNTLPAIYPFT